MDKVVETVRAFFDTHADLPATGIVAVSGGADSVALLTALVELDRFKLVVAHVNHQLRGAESDGDEEFVRELAVKHHLAFESTRGGMCLVERKIEETARRIRYDWFDQIATKLKSYDCNVWVATAHTASDQAETVLHRIIRGTGLAGLRAMEPQLKRDHYNLVRPLLTLSRADVTDYLTTRGVSHRNDSSNDSLRFTRNRIRHEVLPLLRTMNPRVDQKLVALAEEAQKQDGLLDQQCTELLNTAFHDNVGTTSVINPDLFLKAHVLVRQRVLRWLWVWGQWSENDLTRAHWERLADLVEGDYPGGIRLVHAPPVVRLGPTASSSSRR